MCTLPEDLYECLVAALFRGKAKMHTEITHFAHGISLYSTETRRKERRDNVRDIVKVRQTCKAMLAAVRALEKEELRCAVDVFWKGAFGGPTEFFCCPLTHDSVFTGWGRE
jgi:hypothetical protein